MKKRYIEPRIRVVVTGPETDVLGVSKENPYDWSETKGKTDWDDDAWAEEVQTTEAKNPNLWDKEW